MTAKHAFLPALLMGAMLLLSGCGSSDSKPVTNSFSVVLGGTMTLKEGRSTEVSATVVNVLPHYHYRWQQLSGPALVLSNTSATKVQITAPALDADAVAVLALTVSDNAGNSATDTMQISLNANQLPTVSVNDLMLTEKSQAVLSIDARDNDGQITDVDWVQTSGPVLQFTPANSTALTVQVPAINKVEFVTFAITVTDDNGETQTVEHRYRLEPIWQEFTVAGYLAANEMADAKIIAAVNGEVFRAEADANAAYSLTIRLDDDASNDFMLIRAISTSKTGMDLMLALPSLRAKAAAAPLNLTPYSTAILALAARSGYGILPSSRVILQQLEARLNSDEVAEAAIMIAAYAELADNSPVTDQVSVFSMVMDANSYAQFKAEVMAHNADLLQALAERLPQQGSGKIDINALELKTGLRLENAPRTEQSALSTRFYQFAAAQRAQVADEYIAYPADWSIVAGTAQLQARTSAMPLYQLGIDNPDLGLTRQQISALQQAGIESLAVKISLLSERLTRLSIGATKSLYQRTIQLQYHIQPLVIAGENVEFLPLEVETAEYAWGSALYTPTQSVTAQQLLGQWFVPSYHASNVLDQSKVTLQQLVFDSNNLGYNLSSGETFGWNIVYYLDGYSAISLQYASGYTVELRLLKQHANGFTANIFVQDNSGNWLAAHSAELLHMLTN